MKRNRDESKGLPDCSPEQIVALEHIWATIGSPDMVRIQRPKGQLRKGSVQKRTMRALDDLGYLSHLRPSGDFATITRKMIAYASEQGWPIPGTDEAKP